MSKRAVLLDAGGVLLDESQMEHDLCDSVVRLLREILPDYTADQYWRDIDESVERFCPATRPFILWKYCHGDQSLYQGIIDRFQQTRKRASLVLVLMDGIGSELHGLSSRFSLVLAGQYGKDVYDLLARHGLAGLFANRLSQADFSITKPDPRYLERIAVASGFAPGECIMVGDRIDNDIVPGKQNGMGTVFVQTGIYRNQQARTPDELPDVALKGVKGLADRVIAEWGEEESHATN